MSPLRFHVQTAAALGLTGGAALALGCTAVLLGQRRLAGVRGESDCMPALVLGCPVGPAFERRLAAALDLYAAGRARRLVVSGRNEAEWGHSRLVAWGVPADRVALERSARNTWENLRLSGPLLLGGPFHLVTDAWHLPRALLAARQLGLDPRPVAVGGPHRPRMLVREGLSAVMSVTGGHVPIGRWASLVFGNAGAVGEAGER